MNVQHNQDNTLSDDEYYHDQIIGLNVITADDERLGTVTDILSRTINDNYIVAYSEKEVLIPAIKDVIRSIDLDKGTIAIEAINGLLDLNEKKPLRS